MAGRADPGGSAGGADAAARAPEGISRGRKLKVGAGPTQGPVGPPRLEPPASCARGPAWGADGLPDLGAAAGSSACPGPAALWPCPTVTPGPGADAGSRAEAAVGAGGARGRCSAACVGPRVRWTPSGLPVDPAAGTAGAGDSCARAGRRSADQSLAGQGACRASRLALRDSGATCPRRWGRRQPLLLSLWL